jgi:tRNA (guanine26-N2/guanine27-N2)-dimethyltransferase
MRAGGGGERGAALPSSADRPVVVLFIFSKKKKKLAQVVNRDLSIAVLRVFAARLAAEGASKKGGKHRRAKPAAGGGGGEDGGLSAGPATTPPTPPAAPGRLRVLEGLAATGLRAIRYATEIDAVSRVDANDLDAGAVAAIARNVALNGGRAAERVRPRRGDARVVMLTSPSAYEVVDLDPYGSPTDLLDSAVRAVVDGGLLAVTATDLAVLCGGAGEAGWAKYGAYPLHRPYGHEQALRILLASISAAAARAKRVIEPVLSVSIDFYVRVFARVRDSPAAVQTLPHRVAYIWQSAGCDAFWMQAVGRSVAKGRRGGVRHLPGHGPPVTDAGGAACATCPETGAGLIMGGPAWAAPLHEPGWVKDLLTEVTSNASSYPAAARVKALLTTVAEELPDAPLYYSLHSLAKTISVTPPPSDAFRSALVHAGHRVSSTHANPLGVKTDAPPHVVWDVMRCWARAQWGEAKLAEKLKAAPAGSALAGIMGRPPRLQANFARAAGALSASRAAGTARFLPNPEAHWGPKSRHRPVNGGGSGGGGGGGGGAGERPAKVAKTGDGAAPAPPAVSPTGEALAAEAMAAAAAVRDQQQQQEKEAAAV